LAETVTNELDKFNKSQQPLLVKLLKLQQPLLPSLKPDDIAYRKMLIMHGTN